MNSIFKRCSIRKYKDTKVPQEKIELLLKAAMAAPSAGNQQPWHFIVVENKEIIEKLSHTHQYSSFIKNAPLVIVAAYHSEGLMFEQYAHIDMSIACENLWLEATELDLGCVWLGIAPIEDRMHYVEETIDLDQSLHAFALMAIGEKAQEGKVQDRYDPTRIQYLR